MVYLSTWRPAGWEQPEVPHGEEAGPYRAILGLVAFWVSSSLPTLAGIEAIATKSLTIQPAGPRQGEAGSRYFIVEGRKNEWYTSFGVLIFQPTQG
jgi:hypothetical protein